MGIYYLWVSQAKAALHTRCAPHLRCVAPGVGEVKGGGVVNPNHQDGYAEGRGGGALHCSWVRGCHTLQPAGRCSVAARGSEEGPEGWAGGGGSGKRKEKRCRGKGDG